MNKASSSKDHRREKGGYLMPIKSSKLPKKRSIIKKKDKLSVVERNRKRVDELRKNNFALQEEFKFNNKSSIILRPREDQIHSLQSKTTLTAQNLQIQLQKAKYYEKEIGDLKDKLEKKRNIGIDKSKNPDILKKDLIKVKNKLDKKGKMMNETKAKNRQLRKEINKMRKEREIYDGIFTDLEKDILLKEKILLKLIQNENELKKDLKSKEQNFEKMIKHSEKEHECFEMEYENAINGINGATSNSEPNEPQNNQKENEQEKDYIKNLLKKSTRKAQKMKKEEEERLENMRRFEELEDLQNKFNQLELLTQEKDCDFVKEMYLEGKSINKGLYDEIDGIDEKLKLAEAQREELMMKISNEKKSLDEEGQEIFDKLQIRNKELEEITLKEKMAIRKAEDTKFQASNLDKFVDNSLKFLQYPEFDEVEKLENIGRSKDNVLKKIEIRVSDLFYIYHNYDLIAKAKNLDESTMGEKTSTNQMEPEILQEQEGEEENAQEEGEEENNQQEGEEEVQEEGEEEGEGEQEQVEEEQVFEKDEKDDHQASKITKLPSRAETAKMENKSIIDNSTQRNKKPEDMMLDISNIHTSLVNRESERDRENLILESLSDVRRNLAEKVSSKIGVETKPEYSRKTRNRRLTKLR